MNNPSKVKIGKIYYEPDGSEDAFELTLPAEEFKEILTLTEPVDLQCRLMRVEEGVMLLIDQAETEWETQCAHCGATLRSPLTVEAAEWLFYDQKPLEYDDENEFLFIDRHQMEIDILEPLRQELILACPAAPRCVNACKVKVKIAESQVQAEPPRVKALAGLKDLI